MNHDTQHIDRSIWTWANVSCTYTENMCTSYYLKFDSLKFVEYLGSGEGGSDCSPQSEGELNCSPTSNFWSWGQWGILAAVKNLNHNCSLETPGAGGCQTPAPESEDEFNCSPTSNSWGEGSGQESEAQLQSKPRSTPPPKRSEETDAKLQYLCATAKLPCVALLD